MAKIDKLISAAAILIALAALPVSSASNLTEPSSLAMNNSLFVESTISALMTGVFDGTMSFKDLKSYGDFGVGTFDCLDGEMVGLDGEFYQVRSDGVTYPVSDSMEIPFAQVTFFEPDEALGLNSTYNLTQLQSYLDSELPIKNLIYAIRIDGTFHYIKTRAPPAQDEPYPTLTEALKGQKVFEMRNVTGTVVGIWSPAYTEDISVKGYHMHFITADRSKGGHLLDLTLSRNATAQIDILSGLQMSIPLDDGFFNADLSEDAGRQEELKKIESSPM